MDSFLLSETFKYLYLLFDEGHWLRRGTFVFTTEAHPLWIPPVWSSEGNAHWPDSRVAEGGSTAPPHPSPAADTTAEPTDAKVPLRATAATTAAATAAVTAAATAAAAAAEETGAAEPSVRPKRERRQQRVADPQSQTPPPERAMGAPPPVILRPLPPPTCERPSPLTPTPPPDVYGAPPPPLTLFPRKCGLPPRLRASALSGCGFGTPGVDALPVPASALAVPPLPVDVLSALRALGRPLSVGEVVTTRAGARWRLVYASMADGGHVAVDRLDDDEAVGDFPVPAPPLRRAYEREKGAGGGRSQTARRRPRNRAEGWGEEHRRSRRKPPSAAAAGAETEGGGKEMVSRARREAGGAPARGQTRGDGRWASQAGRRYERPRQWQRMEGERGEGGVAPHRWQPQPLDLHGPRLPPFAEGRPAGTPFCSEGVASPHLAVDGRLPAAGRLPSRRGTRPPLAPAKRPQPHTVGVVGAAAVASAASTHAPPPPRPPCGSPQRPWPRAAAAIEGGAHLWPTLARTRRPFLGNSTPSPSVLLHPAPRLLSPSPPLRPPLLPISPRRLSRPPARPRLQTARARR